MSDLQQTLEKPNPQLYEALDFVYCGRRWSEGSGKLVLCLCPIRNNVLGDAMLFGYDRKAHRVVGGVYSGAEFSKEGIRGLSSQLHYVRQWENRSELIDWQARDAQAESVARARKLEGDAKRVTEIERIMLPLRVQFEAYRKMRDNAGMDALRAAVVSALASTPRSTEA